MPTSAVLGYNVDFSINTTGSTYVQVAEVTNISWPGYKRDAIDVTFMDSVDQFREFLPGLMDGGDVTIEFNWVPSATDQILTYMTAATATNFKITYNAGVNVIFKGIVTSYQPQSNLGEKLSASVTFKVSGKPTWAAV